VVLVVVQMESLLELQAIAQQQIPLVVVAVQVNLFQVAMVEKVVTVVAVLYILLTQHLLTQYHLSVEDSLIQ
jgi:hypothetical protein